MENFDLLKHADEILKWSKESSDQEFIEELSNCGECIAYAINHQDANHDTDTN